MRLTLITPPAVEPVTLEEMKDHLRVDHDDEDVVIQNYITAARQKLEGRNGLLGRCLISQKWRMTFDRFTREIELPFPPVQSVDRISYLGLSGDEVVMNPVDYRLSGLGDIDGTKIRYRHAYGWPETYEGDSAFIEFTAGYGDGPADVPEPIRQAIKVYAAHLYENRESTSPPSEWLDLVSDYRVQGF
jgi:uncharacterized phiE125 gp8 family phage protein